MGYLTRYEMSVDLNNSVNKCNFCSEYGKSAIDKIKVYKIVLNLLDFNYFYLDQSMMWYEHETDLKKVSTLLPNIVIILTGHGEEQGDVWRKYFKNGKVQRVEGKFKFEKFDENQLI